MINAIQMSRKKKKNFLISEYNQRTYNWLLEVIAEKVEKYLSLSLKNITFRKIHTKYRQFIVDRIPASQEISMAICLFQRISHKHTVSCYYDRHCYSYTIIFIELEMEITYIMVNCKCRKLYLRNRYDMV